MKDTSTGTIILCCQSLGWTKSREEKFCMVCKYFILILYSVESHGRILTEEGYKKNQWSLMSGRLIQEPIFRSPLCVRHSRERCLHKHELDLLVPFHRFRSDHRERKDDGDKEIETSTRVSGLGGWVKSGAIYRNWAQREGKSGLSLEHLFWMLRVNVHCSRELEPTLGCSLWASLVARNLFNQESANHSPGNKCRSQPIFLWPSDTTPLC